MGRKKIEIKRIESPTARQVTYSKRKSGILKKASELSILCGADVAVVLFSPSGRVTTYPPNARFEDIFLRYFRVPPELRGGYNSHKTQSSTIRSLTPFPNEEIVIQKLKHLKSLRELIERISIRKALIEELNKIKAEHNEASTRLKFFVPDMENIRTVAHAEFYEMFVTRALQRLKKLEEDIVNKKNSLQQAETIKASLEGIEGAETSSAGSAGSNQVSLSDESKNEGNTEATNETSASADKDTIATEEAI